MRLSFTKAFTLLEVVFVIVILGVVSSIGSSVIVQTFDSYIMQRSVHNAGIKTELAINQLANRLIYRMDLSLLARKPGQTGTVQSTDFYPARSVPLNKREEFSALEWIGYDNDSFDTYIAPRWSGYCDLNSTKTTYSQIDSVGSNNNNMYTIIKHYTGTTDGTGGALRFLTANTGLQPYTSACLYGGKSAGCMFPVNIKSARYFTFTGDGNRTAGQMVYSEFYQYATSAFTVVPTKSDIINGLQVYDLDLYYGYQPWQDESYLDGQKSTLLKNVSVFRFKKEENAVRLKLCVIERISDTDQVSICKEKAVIR
ncbi:type II secretion system protein [Sulfurovum sp.]|uniref:type II secretion system protein n=1 Tax=Sulfurovum sp. TaxID=1969726 RepID=UPI0025DF6BF8|nr:type II secretion system protein [Sulfurovum sp.]